MPAEMRNEIWARLGSDLKPDKLDTIVTREIPFAELPKVFAGYFDGSNFGRTVVKVQE